MRWQRSVEGPYPGPRGVSCQRRGGRCMAVVRSSPPDIVRVGLRRPRRDRPRAGRAPSGSTCSASTSPRPSRAPCTSAATRSSSTTASCSARARSRPAPGSGSGSALRDDLDRAERWFDERGCADAARARPARPAASARPCGPSTRSASRSSWCTRWTRSSGSSSATTCAAASSINRHRPRQHRRPRRAAGLRLLHARSASGCRETIEDLSDGTLFAAWMFRKQTVHDVAFTLGAGPDAPPRRLRRARVAQHPRPLRPDRRPRPGAPTSSEALVATACRTPSTCTSATTTAIASRCTRPTTSPVTPATSRCDGTCTTSGAATSGPTPIVPTWYHGSVGVLDLAGNMVAVREQDAPSERRVTVGRRRPRHPRRDGGVGRCRPRAVPCGTTSIR